MTDEHGPATPAIPFSRLLLGRQRRYMAARSAARRRRPCEALPPPDCPKSAERRRRDRRAGKARVKHEPAEVQQLSCTDAILHGRSKSGRRATARRVQESKKGNHSKHIIFSVVMVHAATAFDYNFHLWATKIMDLETVFLSVIPDHRKSRKCAQSWSREAPQIQERSKKRTSGPQCVH